MCWLNLKLLNLFFSLEVFVSVFCLIFLQNCFAFGVLHDSLLEGIAEARNGSSFWWNPFSGLGQEMASRAMCRTFSIPRNLNENLDRNLRFQAK